MKATKRRRRRSRRGSFNMYLPKLIAGALVVVAVVLVSLLFRKDDVSLLKPYEAENQAANISRSFQIDTTLFASDLCVLAESGQPEDALDAGAALIFNISDEEVVYDQKAFDRLNPASTTKVMTYLVAAKYGDLSQEVTITDTMLDLDPASSVAGLKGGDKIAMKDLLYGMLMVSGNDAAQAIALTIGGTEEGFAALMNEMAWELGATGTHFVNAHGLTHDQHYTTAYDLYLIFNEAIKYDIFNEIIHTANYQTTYYDKDGNPKELSFETSNLFLRGNYTPPENITVVGGKTGTTNAARNCLILLSRDMGGAPYISVILSSKERDILYKEMIDLLDEIN